MVRGCHGVAAVRSHTKQTFQETSRAAAGVAILLFFLGLCLFGLWLAAGMP